MSTNSGSSSLRPAWKGGRGFQPPPTVTETPPAPATKAGRSASVGDVPPGKDKRDSNKFSALVEDEDDFVPVASSNKRGSNRGGGNNRNDGDRGGGGGGGDNEPPKQNSRSEAFRSSFTEGRRVSKPSGRSLADLAARVPEGAVRSASTGTPGAGRFSGLGGRGGGGGGSTGDPAADADNARPPPGQSEYKKAVDAAKVIRYTREKLLSIRPRPAKDATPPAQLKNNADATLLISEAPQDPVCWDAFESDEIWATVPSRRTSGAPGLVKGPGGPDIPPPPGERRRSYNAPNRGRWERGVALPPPGEAKRNSSGKEIDANSPNDLWDDPIGGGGAAGAAMDFSAFGGMPEGDLAAGGGGGGADAFDFEKMAEASKKFEEELHGSKGSDDLNEDDDNQDAHLVKVDPKRPLASAGTTIRSGSGDDVNVFEDFDAPTENDEAAGGAEPPAKGAEEDPDATSRLMAMIGVKKEEDIPATKSDSASVGDAPKDGLSLLGLGGPSSSTTIPLNPWGDPIIPSSSPGQPKQQAGLGMDLASRLESFAAEQKARESQEMQQNELLRRRQEQEEAQRRALAQQQQQQQRDQERARQEALQQQQQNPQNQVELVLMERISTILENSWGRSDLMSILATLHAEDSRVIPLLSNVNLLRDLIAHNPRRVALRQDPAFGTEMAVLVMTNAQWQQDQQQQAQARAQQEELRRREEQLRMENMQRQRSMSDNPPVVNPDAPWFYSDPQGNIQGPFRSDEMRQWLEAGYFKGDLPISQQANGPFIPLSAIFRDLSVAFNTQQADTAQDDAAARARAEEERRLEERRRAEELEKQRRAEQEAREAAERQRREMEAAAAAANSNGENQNQSAQLKMMLGLPQQQQQNQPEAADENGSPAQAEKPKQVEKQTDKRSSKADKNNNNKQKKDQAPAAVAAEQAPKPTAKPAAPAWGGAAQAAPATRKSMSEIQKEEARRAAAVAAQQGNQSRQPSSGWANVAAAGKSSWTPGTVKPTAAAVVGANAAPAMAGSNRVGTQPAGARPNRQPSPAGQQRQAGTQQQPQRRSNSTNSTAEEFGATMSPQLESWCKEQMQKLNGTDDLTLVAFCMTLTDPVEIRQYLTTYLGSTPPVNKFANEFINKRGIGGAPQQEEWETPGSAKKGKKKKAR